jgi:hypothetical protein
MEIGIRSGEGSPDGRLHVFLKIDEAEQYNCYKSLTPERQTELEELRLIYDNKEATPQERAETSIRILSILLEGLLISHKKNEPKVVELTKPL